MTTLKGQELQEYLTALQNKIASQDPNQAHSYMQKILEAEKNFLKYQQKSGIEAQLAFSPNGLPTIESLKADLETICSMEEFKEIAQTYQPKTDNNPGVEYAPITEKDWNKEKNNYKPEELNHKTTLTLQENKQGKLEITITDGTYTKGYDEHSQKHPILQKTTRAAYQVNWNTLFTETETNYHKANRALATKSEQSLEKVTNLQVARSFGADVFSKTTFASVRHFGAEALQFSKATFMFIYTPQKLVRRKDIPREETEGIYGLSALLGTIVHNIWYIPVAFSTEFFEMAAPLATGMMFLPTINIFAAVINDLFEARRKKLESEKK